MQPAATESPLFVLAMCLLALGPLVWMARAWIREWRSPQAGVLSRDLRPPPPTLHQPWRWRMLLVYGAQAVVIGGGMWLIFWAAPGPADPHAPPQAYLVVFGALVCLVAFSTAVLTRLWDLSRGALARRRSARRQSQ